MAKMQIDHQSRAVLPEVITIEDDMEMPSQMTPEKMTPPKRRRMPFPKLNVKKLRLMFAPAGLQIKGRFFSKAKWMGWDDLPPQVPESSEEEDDGSWAGPPVPAEDSEHEALPEALPHVGAEVAAQVGNAHTSAN